ncbi:transcription factor Tfb2-domain-containing protein [Obelidium mucronatum]|nr:transcription factor Tfb2-domain-containing protein [Obelidium mucronatum]
MATILEHIQALDRNTLTRLYHQPATCLAMLRLLQPLAKHVVMRLLFVSAVEMVVVSAWIYAERQTALEEALASLFKFNIASSENGVLKINAVYQANLKNALVGGGNTSSFGLPTDSKDKKDITTDYLDTYARESWEAVLHFLVGTPTDKKPSAVVALMEGSGLMARNAMRSSDELRITNKGFQFLLQDVNEQVWGFLLQYLEMAEPKLGMDPVDVLNFLFQLGSLEFGQDYSVDVLTDTQKQMLDDLKHFGLVYQRKKKSSRFYPTRLATSLTSGASASGDTGDAGYIIVETNFKVYAYTTSPLQIAVLSLFLSLKARFSNMVIGVLTRDSVRQAYDNGISADQICQFLTNHAHPEMKKQLPPTVVDQIRLWESERKRAVAMPAHLYLDFPRNVDYLEAVGFARSLGYVLWSSDEKRMFAVSIEGHNRMREYLASKKR